MEPGFEPLCSSRASQSNMVLYASSYNYTSQQPHQKGSRRMGKLRLITPEDYAVSKCGRVWDLELGSVGLCNTYSFQYTEDECLYDIYDQKLICKTVSS